MAAVCNRDCFHCIYEDCICDDIFLEDFQAEKEIDLISGAKSVCLPIKIQNYRKKYYEDNKERLKEYQNRYNAEHREQRRAYKKENRERDSAYKKAYQKLYREKNHEKIALVKRLKRAEKKLISLTSADLE